MPEPKPLRFTAMDLEEAHEAWGCNCGPGALAAILGLTLDQVRPLMGDFEQKRYTNPTLMLESLRRAGARLSYRGGHLDPADMPNYGLARIQWEGPWTQPGLPMRARYRYTHWVGSCRIDQPRAGRGRLGVFDINCMNSGGWVGFDDWSDAIVPNILKQCVPRADGKWHVTHAIEVTP